MNKLLVSAAVFGFLAMPLTVDAALITYEFSTGTTVPGNTAGAVEQYCPDGNCPISGRIVFDTEALSTFTQLLEPAGAINRYDSAVVYYEVSYWTGLTVSSHLAPGESYLQVYGGTSIINSFLSVSADPLTPGNLFDMNFDRFGRFVFPATLHELLTIEDWPAHYGFSGWTFYLPDGPLFYEVYRDNGGYFRQVPEPGTLALLGLGLLGVGYARHRNTA